MALLGIDVGTSAVKVVLYDGGRTLSDASAPLAASAPHAGWSEQAPEAWWQATCRALAKLGDLSGVRAVGLSGQMHGAVLLDRHRQVLRRAILWNDNRAHAQCATLSARCPDIAQIAGVPPLPGFTAPKLIWVKEHEPEVYGQIRHVLLPKDYVGMRLHGELATDCSDAAGTLWFDQARRAWHEGLCASSDTSPDWLPRLHDGASVCGTLSCEAAGLTGVPAGVPVVAGAGDAAAGAISVGVSEPGEGFLSLGTSGQLFLAGAEFRPNPDAFVHAFAHTLPGRWYQMAALLNGARPLAWLAGILGCEVAEVLAGAEQGRPERLPVFLPYLTGERSPLGDPLVRAGFAGLEDHTSRADMCLAVVEAIAFSFADGVESLGNALDNVPSLSVIGGGSRSDLLLAKIAAITGKTLLRRENPGAGAATGAALLAGMGLGEITAVAPGRVLQSFAPRPDPGLNERHARTRALYQLLGKGRFPVNESAAR